MSPEDQKQWELEEMLKPIDLEKAQIHIDPSPFQLVERTSILKVHSLFSMVGINHAYVTKIGRLVGVVGLKEVGSLQLTAISSLINLYISDSCARPSRTSIATALWRIRGTMRSMAMPGRLWRSLCYRPAPVTRLSIWPLPQWTRLYQIQIIVPTSKWSISNQWIIPM